MAAFTALNIEYDNVSDVEVDDTRELQIEEALKLYQTALKHHSEGPESYDKAAAAYKALFESDIFKYSESQSELWRSEHFGDALEYDILLLQHQAEPGDAQLAVPVDATPNTLQQILHLAYKNHGQFLLDLLQHNLRSVLEQKPNLPQNQSQIAASATQPLEYFAEALDKDDADLDLWRSASSVAAIVGSVRISRYCLEAVLDGDEDGLDTVLNLPGIEEGFALQALHELVQNLKDDLSSLLAPLANLRRRRRRLAGTLQRQLEYYATIPRPEFEEAAYSLTGHLGKSPMRYVVTTARRDWTSVGETILQQLALESGGVIDVGPGIGVGFKLPEPPVSGAPTEMPIRAAQGEKLRDAAPTPSDRNSEDAKMTSSKTTSSRTTSSKITSSNGSDEAPDTANLSNEGNAALGQLLRLVPELRSGLPGQNTVVTETAGFLEKVGQANEEMKRRLGKPQDTEGKDTNDKEDAQGEDGSRTRKRSTSSAGFPETADGGRARRKRIRTREGPSAVDSVAENTSQQFQDRLQDVISGDEWLFDTVGSILDKFAVKGLGSSQELRQFLSAAPISTDEHPQLALNIAIKDLFELSQNCTPEKTAVLTSGESVDKLAAAPIEVGLHALTKARSEKSRNHELPLFDDNNGVDKWVEEMNSFWHYNRDAACSWLAAFIRRNTFPGSVQNNESSYIAHRWHDDLKRVVVQMAIHADEYVFCRLQNVIAALEQKILTARTEGEELTASPDEMADIEMIQSLFELHLDAYKRFKHPGSGIDALTLASQKYRLERWSNLANSAINLRGFGADDLEHDILGLRHIWTVAFQISTCDDVSQNHVIACMHDLKDLLVSLNEPRIRLQNNAIMPEISIAAVEQELSEINMQDFFRKVFSHDEKNPVAVIEGLEPLLESAGASQVAPQEDTGSNDVIPDSEDTATEDDDPDAMKADDRTASNEPLEEMRKFLSNGPVSLRLTLWQRLRLAYEAIDYPSKVFSCHLRSIELLVREFTQPSYVESTNEQRGFLLLRWLCMIDEFLKKILELNKNISDPFECIDENHLKSSMSAIASLSRLLHVFNVYEDQVRVGQLPAPLFEGRPKPSFMTVANKIYDIQINAWIVQYYLLKEAINQDPEKFPTPAEDRLEYLRVIHYALGLRALCSRANGALLKLERDELLELSDVEYSDVEMCQVLFDLYGIKCFTNPSDLLEHGCSSAETMTRTRATKLLGFIMSQAAKIPMKDIPKTELKTSIDKVHGWLGKPKYTEDLQLNGRIVRAFLRGPINPLDLFSCIRGTLALPVKPIPDADAPIHAKGWFALMGNISLSKFRSQKRLQPGPTEDLNFAIAFYLQDLEFSTDRWESWYHLAQCYDLQLEEGISWSAEKVNTNSLDIQQQQRAAIHCYSMAVAAALRNAELTPESKTKVAELFSDFGNRVYSSSREPLLMRAFGFRDIEEKYYSGSQMYKLPPFHPLHPFVAWKFGAALLKQSILRVSDNWMTHYMLGKCLWKMYNADDKIRGERRPPTMQDVLNCFIHAIESLPKPGRGKEPILEPHYKLVSSVHKLVQRKDLDPKAASEILQATPYASKIDPPNELDAWNPYILKVLKELRNADKSNWHHRMTFRAAVVIYADSDQDESAVIGARHELTQQMFTKTMQMQVWKPEYERPGRHFVYTSLYLRFFVRLLVQLNDRPNLEALVRRLRRKPHDFFEHTRLWHETCLSYLRLLRRVGQVPEGYEDHVFKSLNHEDFSARSARLEAWCHAPTTQSETLDVLRDVTELKKLNNGLMKPTLIDDLLCDTYAKLYEDAGPLLDSLPPPPGEHGGNGPNGMSNIDGATEAARPPVQLQFQPGYQPGQPTAETHVPRPRAKGVGRRELQRKAEAAVNRPVAAAVASIAPRPANGGGAQTIQALVPTSRPSTDGGNSNGASAGTGPAAANVATSGGGQHQVENSAPASVHDSADDESGSELTELEEPTPPRPMFPGLAARAIRLGEPESPGRCDQRTVAATPSGGEAKKNDDVGGQHELEDAKCDDRKDVVQK